MKKTLTINLGGTVFHIDEDAYRLLDKYLSNLKYYFKKEEGSEEIIKDIESRISELFTERINAGYQVITIENVESIIARIGKPEELSEDEENRQTSSGTNNQSYNTRENSSGTPRKLYRDPDNRTLGGVAGGLAAYMDWDPTIVRLILFGLFIVSKGTFTIAYIICWIIIPLARTAAEKLSMRGQKVTVENIGKTVTDGFERMTDGINDYVNSGKPRSAIQKLGDFFVQVIGLVLKIILVIIAIAFSPVLFVLIVCFIAFIIAAIALTFGSGTILYHLLPSVDWSLISVTPVAVIALCIAFILLIGIPLVAMIYAIFSQLFNWSPMASGLKWTLVMFWIISLIVSIVIMWNTGLAIPDYLYTISII